jgi:hypothetical protein
MPFTLGGVGGDGDDATWTESASAYGTSARSSLVCGWFFPTALTSGRTLWSFNLTSRCSIATTTSEIDLFLQRTTPSQHTTSGLGLVTNKWHFIAVLGSFFNTGVVTNYRVWRGVETDVPSLVTVNITTGGAGNSTGQTIATVGNLGSTGAVCAFGDYGRFDFVTATLASTLCTNATGLISADDESAIFNRLVIPIWNAKFPTFYNSGQDTNSGITHIAQDFTAGAYGRSIRLGSTTVTMDRTIAISAAGTGSGLSQNAEPFRAIGPLSWPDRLRR